MFATLRRRALAAAAVVALVPTVAVAQVTVHTTLASWLEATSAQGTDTFDDLLSATTPSPLDRTAGAYAYRASVTGSNTDFFPAGTDADRWLSTDNATASMVFSNFGASAQGIGGFFFLSNVVGAFVPTGSLTVAVLTSVGNTSVTLTNPTTSTFWGITTSGTITSMTVTATQPQAGGFVWATVNDFRIGQLANNVVPEPSTYALMATGITALAAIRRRRA